MGVQLTLKDILSGFQSASAKNANNTLLEAALNKALDRTGATDNAMEVDLDMGLNFINNVKTAALEHQAINLGQASSLVTASSDQITSTADRDVFISNAGQTLFNLTNIEYVTGVNALQVYVNGVYQTAGTAYTETSTTSITFDEGLDLGDEVVVVGARFDAAVLFDETVLIKDNASDFADAASGFADDAAASAVDASGFADDAEAAAGYKLEVNNQAGTSYTLVIADEGDLIRMSNAGANTVTVPPNASVPFQIGTVVNVRQSGAGTTTIAPGSGVTINAPNNEFTTGGEEFGIGLVKVATDEWDLVKSYAGVRVDQFDSNINPGVGLSGYQKLPTGLILQWGRNTGSPSGSTYNLPIEFPTDGINLTVSNSGEPGTGDTVGGSFVSKSQITLYRDGQAGSLFWFAIGV